MKSTFTYWPVITAKSTYTVSTTNLNAVIFLNEQINRWPSSSTHHVEELDGHREVRVLLRAGDDGRGEDVAGALDVDARTVDHRQLDTLQLSQAPEQHLRPTDRDWKF